MEKKFVITSKWLGSSGSIIPGSIDNSPVYCEVCSEDDLDYIFRVYLDSSEKGGTKKIRDSYCWKYLREQLRIYIQKSLEGTVTLEYKLVINVNPDITFDNNVNSESRIQSYFNYANKKIDISIAIILNKKMSISEKDILRDKLNIVLKDFYKKYDKNMYIELECLVANTQDDYRMLNERNKENKNFVTLKYFSSSNYDPWGVNLENMFYIDDIDKDRNGVKYSE